MTKQNTDNQPSENQQHTHYNFPEIQDKQFHIPKLVLQDPPTVLEPVQHHQNNQNQQSQQQLQTEQQPKQQSQQPQILQQKPQQQQQKQIQKHKSSMKIYLKCLIICMGSIYMGYNIGVVNLAYPKLEHEYDINTNKELYKGLFSSSLLFGATIGCFLAGGIIQRVGERKCAIICDIIAIVLCLFYLIPEYYLALVVRFFMGIILGINISTVSPFIKAISPTAILGKTGSFQSLFISTGVLIAVCIGQGYPTDDEEIQDQNQYFWRFTLMFPILTCSIRLFSFLTIYRLDTPNFYLQHAQQDKCRQALQQTYHDEFIQEQYEIIEHNIELLKKQKDTWATVFQKQARNRIELSLVIQCIFQMSGIMAIMLYSNTIFLKTTGDKEISKIMNIGAAACQAIPAFISGELSKFWGRRPIFLVGYSILVAILASLGTITLVNKDELEDEDVPAFSSIFTIAMIFIFCFIFRLTSGTVTWTYVSEIVSTKGNSIATAMHFFSAFVIGLLFPICVEEFGIHTMFFFFAVTLFLGILYLYPRLKETKGLIAREIRELFSQQNNQNNQQQPNNVQEIKNTDNCQKQNTNNSDEK